MAKAELSRKQAQVVTLVQQGKSVKQIARRMKISDNGVYGHMRKIKEKELGHLLEGAPAPTPASSNGSSENGEVVSEALTRLHAQITEAIGTADERLQEIETRRQAIREQVETLTQEGAELARESEQLVAERGKLVTV